VDEDANQCELKVIDNGSGFDLDAKRSGGIGLISMKERASRVGGQVMLESKENTGTMVRFICPLIQNKGNGS
jgi:signal transduction histidine kinase